MNRYCAGFWIGYKARRRFHTGWATPSEAGGLGAVLSLFFVMTIYRIYRPRQLWPIFIKALNESSMILMIG